MSMEKKCAPVVIIQQYHSIDFLLDIQQVKFMT